MGDRTRRCRIPRHRLLRLLRSASGSALDSSRPNPTNGSQLIDRGADQTGHKTTRSRPTTRVWLRPNCLFKPAFLPRAGTGRSVVCGQTYRLRLTSCRALSTPDKRPKRKPRSSGLAAAPAELSVRALLAWWPSRAGGVPAGRRQRPAAAERMEQRFWRPRRRQQLSSTPQ